MPSLKDLMERDLLWREGVMAAHGYLEWVRQAAEHPDIFGDINDALKEPAS
jgi:hypothetical protein